MEDFFEDYNTLKCNYQEFQILKRRLHDAGWSWNRSGDLISLLEKNASDDIIRDYNLNQLGIK